ncbi:argininosuccinate lyase [Pandoraea aquatica]|uniref:Argininosuccinate lyase n=1 Tax=Pandoraea aquatica TaxID=2508290 RepID=A0A5E4RHJ7_9BURK|nr:argininosuccinate lyase [Pandoraea aquatica]VVD62645.1 argininosuccinate lyase [Pandoraea aquatica]
MSTSKVSRRLTEAAAPEVNDIIFKPRLDGFDETFVPLGDINKAHVVMLAEQGLIRPEHASALARGILAMEDAGPGAVPLDPSREDSYFNYEAHLMDNVGADVGGRMHTGRSRNDILATLDRLRGRAVLLDLVDALLRVRETALVQAAHHADIVMPGYTHLQPAQPITYGFYLAGVAQALERDTRRLMDTLTNMNVSPLGAAAFAGTPFAIDRQRTADLLGFDTFVDNALDAVGSRDFVLESIADLSLLAVLWSRVAQDYFVWTTHEFGLIEFPDSVATTSSIMPQKKNPVVLEYLKGRTGQIVAALMASAMAIKGTNFTHSGDASREGTQGFWDTAREAIRCLQLLELVLRTARPVASRAGRLAAEDFSTATALADHMVREHDLSFRAAHHVVGSVVRSAMDQGVPADRIDVAMVEAAAREQLGAPLGIDAASVRACLDPASNVAGRASAGSPNPQTLRAHLEDAQVRLDDARTTLAGWHTRLADARQALQSATRALAGLQ